MSEEKCNCLECRLRAQIGSEGPVVNIVDVLNALGNISSELLAHVPNEKAKAYVDELLDARKRWLEEPSVAVQQKPAGNA